MQLSFCLHFFEQEFLATKERKGRKDFLTTEARSHRDEGEKVKEPPMDTNTHESESPQKITENQKLMHFHFNIPKGLRKIPQGLRAGVTLLPIQEWNPKGILSFSPGLARSSCLAGLPWVHVPKSTLPLPIGWGEGQG